MRIRTLKPEWLDDERLQEAGNDARTLSVALILMADDKGRGRIGRATAAKVFPCDAPGTFESAISRLTPWYVRLYDVRGQRYFEICNWLKHQRIDRPSKPTTPEPSEGSYVAEDSADVSLVPQPDIEERLSCSDETFQQSYKGSFTDPGPDPIEYTYLLQAGECGLVKIGKSSRPRQRIASLKAGNLEPLRLIALSMLPERVIQEEFAHLRVRGEWFSPSFQMVERLSDPFPSRARRGLVEDSCRDLDLDLDHDQEHRSIRAREAAAKLTQLDPPLRDTLPAPPVQTTRGQVSAAFAREYEQRRGILWNATSHFVELEGIAEWIDRQASRESVKPDDVRKRLMANWFAHKWGQKCDFKPRELLKCIGEVYAPPVIEAKDEPDPEVINARRLRERKRQEERELHEKLNGHAQTASKPPALEELMVGIGRRM